jgi:hypothetical protein
MKRFLAMIAFVLFLRGGGKSIVLDAVGFIVGKAEYKQENMVVIKPSYLFFDKDGKPIIAVPIEGIIGMLFTTEDRVM